MSRKWWYGKGSGGCSGEETEAYWNGSVWVGTHSMEKVEAVTTGQGGNSRDAKVIVMRQWSTMVKMVLTEIQEIQA